MRKQIIRWITFAALGIAILWSSCTENPEILSDDELKEVINKTAQLRVDSLKPKWRSYCDDNLDALITHTVDSIITAYLMENPLDTSGLPSFEKE